MRPRLLNTAAVTSLLISIGLVPLWCRSVTRQDAVTFVRSNGVGYHLATCPHGLDLGWSDGYALRSPWALPRLHAGWNRTDVLYGVSYGRPVPDDAPINGLPSGNSLVTGTSTFALSDSIDPAEPSHHFAGFGWTAQTYTPPPTFVALPTSFRNADVYLPFAFLLPACLALPAWRLWSAVRRRRLRLANRCLGCGYDLRASPGRCPECGAVAVQ